MPESPEPNDTEKKRHNIFQFTKTLTKTFKKKQISKISDLFNQIINGIILASMSFSFIFNSATETGKLNLFGPALPGFK
jgi:hypothetical protein